MQSVSGLKVFLAEHQHMSVSSLYLAVQSDSSLHFVLSEIRSSSFVQNRDQSYVYDKSQYSPSADVGLVCLRLYKKRTSLQDIWYSLLGVISLVWNG